MKKLTEHMKKLYGERGEKWLDSISSIVKELSQKWNLVELEQLKGLTYNYVAKATRINDFQHKKERENVILKIGIDNKEIIKESNAIENFDSNGCIKILEKDLINNALLLEQIIPGNSLKSLYPDKDDEAITHCVNVITKLHSIKTADTNLFVDISEWFNIFNIINTDKIPKHLADKVKTITPKILSNTKNKVLLHGDLHHDNIIKMQDDWVAIDPKGIIGDPAFEVGPFIFNPISDILDHKNLKQLVQNRIKLFSQELKINFNYLKECCFIRTMLGAYWSVSSDLDASLAIEIAKIINDIK